MLKKTVLLILTCMVVLSGCGKKQTPKQAQPESTPPVSSATKQGESTPEPAEGKSEQKKQDEAVPKAEDLEKLVDELNETKDEGKRRELLDKIQGILEQAEAKRGNN
jgi:uncharacterized Zn finger protein (UPF0148 family)